MAELSFGEDEFFWIEIELAVEAGLGRFAEPTTADWNGDLERWLAPFLARLGHKARRRNARFTWQG